jgi:hypothetical protein
MPTLVLNAIKVLATQRARVHVHCFNATRECL